MFVARKVLCEGEAQEEKGHNGDCWEDIREAVVGDERGGVERSGKRMATYNIQIQPKPGL